MTYYDEDNHFQFPLLGFFSILVLFLALFVFCFSLHVIPQGGFKVLSNPIRLKILALCIEKERSSRELREKLGISKPLLIVHLRKLISMGS